MKSALCFVFGKFDGIFVGIERRESIDAQKVDIGVLVRYHFLDFKLDKHGLDLGHGVASRPVEHFVCEILCV